jgi:hypothetical protein
MSIGKTNACITHTNNHCATRISGKNSAESIPKSICDPEAKAKTSIASNNVHETMLPKSLADSDIIFAKIQTISNNPMKSERTMSPIFAPMDGLVGLDLSTNMPFPVIGKYSWRNHRNPSFCACTPMVIATHIRAITILNAIVPVGIATKASNIDPVISSTSPTKYLVRSKRSVITLMMSKRKKVVVT